MLPIRKVVLYKHGVGYFEREGEIVDDAVVDLQFRASEMNDVLKSLTTLDLGDGHISSISYESTKPVERQLEDIAIRLSDQNSLTGLLAQVKGARVSLEVGPRKVEGVVLGTEQVSKQIADGVLSATYLSLLVDGATIQSFDLLEVKGATFLDESVKKDLQHLLDVLIAAKKKDLKKLTIFGKGKGRRPLLASYTIETPVWKTSYRVLLGEKKNSIQGWALVDNTQEEDWENVVLTLVAGLPISFVHDLYSPRYKRRPIVQVQEEEAYAPPVMEAANEVMDEDSAEGYGSAGPAASAPAPMRAKKMGRAEMAEARERSTPVQTRTVEVGDLFQYEIKNPVTVKRNQSALVPILQGGFDGKRVAVYNPEIRAKNPMSAVLFKNTTGMTLEGGPLTVLEDESYVGESMLDTMKPDEERLVPYSVELGCVISVDPRSERKDVHYAQISNGTLFLYRYRIERKVYVIQNKSDRKLDLFLEHRFLPGWELVESEKPVERTDSFYRFRTEVPAKKTVKFTVSEKGDESESHGIQSVGRDQLKVWLESKFIDMKTLGVLQAVLDLNDKAAALTRRLQEREREIAELFQNQERLRKNLQALGSTRDEGGLRERYVSELAAEEDKLAADRADIKKTREEKAKVEEDLRARLGKLKYEATL